MAEVDIACLVLPYNYHNDTSPKWGDLEKDLNFDVA